MVSHYALHCIYWTYFHLRFLFCVLFRTKKTNLQRQSSGIYNDVELSPRTPAGETVVPENPTYESSGIYNDVESNPRTSVGDTSAAENPTYESIGIYNDVEELSPRTTVGDTVAVENPTYDTFSDNESTCVWRLKFILLFIWWIGFHGYSAMNLQSRTFNNVIL